MAAMRRTTWLAATLLTVSLLGACGGSDDEPLVEPTSNATSSAAADPDGFTAEQREVADAVQAYSDASLALGTDPIEGSPVESLLTPALAARLATVTRSDDEKRDYIGTVKLLPSSVTIDGDAATYDGCQDGSQAYSVPEGDTAPGVGSSNVGYTRLTYGLVRQDDRWLINDPKGEPVSSC